MIFDWILFFNVILAIIVIELPILAFLILVMNPKKAKSAVLDAIAYDTDFQTILMSSLVANASKPMKFKDANGQVFEESPIKMIAKISAEEFQARFKSYIGGKQSEMIRDMESNAEKSMQLMPDNPMLALAMAQLPKKYLPYAQIIANLILQNQRQ